MRFSYIVCLGQGLTANNDKSGFELKSVRPQSLCTLLREGAPGEGLGLWWDLGKEEGGDLTMCLEVSLVGFDAVEA